MIVIKKTRGSDVRKLRDLSKFSDGCKGFNKPFTAIRPAFLLKELVMNEALRRIFFLLDINPILVLASNLEHTLLLSKDICW